VTAIPHTDLLTALRSAMADPSTYQPPADAIPIGISGLNDLLTPGTLTVIAGRWGHGSDILATNIARVVSTDHGVSTLFTSCRDLDRVVMERLIAAQAGVKLSHFHGGKLTDGDRARITGVADEIKAAPLFINSDDRSVSGVERHITKTRAKLAVIEGCHLLLDEEPVRDDAHRASIQSFELMRLARRAGIPIVVSVPLAPRRDRPVNARPVLSDFSYRQPFVTSADVAILVHCPELNGESLRTGEIDIVVAKRRNGHTSSITARIQPEYDRIVDFPSPGNVINFPTAGAL
jgi:replicative DNA helicase